jgi:hypothetical protein
MAGRAARSRRSAALRRENARRETRERRPLCCSAVPLPLLRSALPPLRSAALRLIVLLRRRLSAPGRMCACGPWRQNYLSCARRAVTKHLLTEWSWRAVSSLRALASSARGRHADNKAPSALPSPGIGRQIEAEGRRGSRATNQGLRVAAHTAVPSPSSTYESRSAVRAAIGRRGVPFVTATWPGSPAWWSGPRSASLLWW